VSLERPTEGLDEAALGELMRVAPRRGDAFRPRAPPAGAHGTPSS
jgi:hypothetical protein